MMLRPKNWDRFQHYKDRSPPWIKLHRDVLNDRAFMLLAPATRGVVVLLWLLASESDDGAFDGDPDEIAFRLRITPKEAKSAIDQALQIGFLSRCEHDASNVPATCSSETEGETEREVQSAAPAAAPRPPKAALLQRPDDVTEQVWPDWLAHRKAKRAPVTATALDGIRREAQRAGLSLDEALRISIAQGWQGFRADWLQGKGGKVVQREPEHPRNVPLGAASCRCRECEKHREKQARDTALRRAPSEAGPIGNVIRSVLKGAGS